MNYSAQPKVAMEPKNNQYSHILVFGGAKNNNITF